MKQLTEVAGVDRRPQLIQCEELRSNFLRRFRLRSLDGLNPTRKHMEAVGVSCRIRAEIPAGAPLAATNTRFLKQLPFRRLLRVFPGCDDTSRQFHHHSRGSMPILPDDANPVILIQTYGVGPVRIAEDIKGRNAYAAGRCAVLGPQINPAV